MDESVEQFDSGVDCVAPTWRDTTVYGGELDANGDTEGERVTAVNGQVAHQEARQSVHAVGKRCGHGIRMCHGSIRRGARGFGGVAFLAGTNITFTAAVIDPESDHLTFIWDRWTVILPSPRRTTTTVSHQTHVRALAGHSRSPPRIPASVSTRWQETTT